LLRNSFHVLWYLQQKKRIARMQVLIVTEVSSVEPVLMPLLRQDLHRQGLGHCVAIGDKAVDYSHSFRLILTTRNAAISLPPAVAPLLTVANFAITESALQSQLLAQTLLHEQLELEEQHRCALRFLSKTAVPISVHALYRETHVCKPHVFMDLSTPMNKYTDV
jgi:hypothetical protein